jgi:putative endonuclease
MWYVYIIRSIDFPQQEYVGATADLKRRLPEHNAGKSTHTAKFKPWQLVWYCAFPDKYKALEFEKYLKSHLRPGICEEASVMLNALDILFTKLRKKRP